MIHLALLVIIVIGNYVIEYSGAENIKLKKIVFMGLCIFLFAALRAPTVGVDALRYYKQYSSLVGMKKFSEIINTSYRDKGWYIFISVLSIFFHNPQMLLVIVAAIVAVSFSILAYHEDCDPFLPFIMFICFRMYSFTMSGLRQAVAMGILWIAYVMLKKNRLVLTCILIVVASVFHASALAFFIAIPLVKIESNKIVYCATFGAAFLDIITSHRIISAVVKLLFGTRFSNFIDTANNSSMSFSFTFFVYLIIFVIMVLFNSDIEKEDEFIPMKARISSMGISTALISRGFPNLFRVAYYFNFVMYFSFSAVVNTLFTPRSRKTCEFIVAVLLIAQYVILGPTAGTENYVFFWNY